MTERESNQQPYPQNYPPYYEDEINLIDYIRVLWKWKGLVVAGTLVCAIVAMGITMVRYPANHVTECTISLNFPGIEEHKNPDGTLFNKEQIITPAILTRATAFLQKKDMVFGDMRGMVGITAVIPPEIQEKIGKAKKGGESYTFYPNQFSLAITLEQNDVFSIRERNQILLSIVDEYRKDFEKKYGEEPLVAIEFPANFLANSDYLDVINTFKARTNNFIKFLDSRIAKAGFFRSQETGYSFMDVKNDLELLKNIEISEIEATIKTLKLTKNKENLIAGVDAKKLEIDKEFLEEEIALLKEKEKENTVYVQTGLKDIKDRIVALSKRANELNVEYLANLISNAVQVIKDPETYKTKDVSMKKIVLLAGVVALFMFVFLAFFIEYIRKAQKSIRAGD